MRLESPRPRVASHVRERAEDQRGVAYSRRVVRRFAGEVLAQHVKERAVMNTWVSTWTAKSLT